MKKKTLVNRISWILIFAGMFIALWPYLSQLPGIYSQQQLEGEWQREAKAPAPKQTKHTEHEYVPSRLRIPSIGMEAIVVQGVDEASLRRGPGHFPDTELPGALGNCCIAAHRNMYGRWFSKLNRLDKGDYITISQPHTTYVYRVTQKYVIKPNDMRPLARTPKATLTLVTCTPVPRPTHRLIVKAEMVETRKTTD